MDILNKFQSWEFRGLSNYKWHAEIFRICVQAAEDKTKGALLSSLILVLGKSCTQAYYDLIFMY